MDQSNDELVTVARGHTYGNTSVGGNATVVVGDVHNHNQVASEDDKLERQRKGTHQSRRLRITLKTDEQ